MDAVQEPNPEQNELSSQAGQAKSATNEPITHDIKSWDENKLLEWIQQKLPTPLEPADAQKILELPINGSIFLQGAGDWKFFDYAGFSFSPGVQLAELAKLAREISKHYLSCYGRNLDS